ncbi:MAG: DUF4398 domain-containing protein, partial [bacterium]|nr:DUF4398 domain-containing protein [bacterium]
MPKPFHLVVPTLLIACLVAGCQTGSGIHSIPTARDYRQLESADVGEASSLLEQAQSAGAPLYAPYEYYSARNYLLIAQQRKAAADRKGYWDYARLARDMAESALAKGSGLEEPAQYKVPANRGETDQAFERLKAAYLELGKSRAVEVAPVLYADLTAALSAAEHELVQSRSWRKAAQSLARAEADINTLLTVDSDGDGILDVNDADPKQAEDEDGFQDEDGAPDPDNDQDGIPDANDAAPLEPETINRWQDTDGLPDEYPQLETIYFDMGSAVLTEDVKGYLRGITPMLVANPKLIVHAS